MLPFGGTCAKYGVLRGWGGPAGKREGRGRLLLYRVAMTTQSITLSEMIVIHYLVNRFFFCIFLKNISLSPSRSILRVMRDHLSS